MSKDLAIKYFGTDEPLPERTVLTAGPLTVTLESGQLRWIKIGETEVIRAISFLIRDRNWSTAVPEISELKVEQNRSGFKVTFAARCLTIDGALTWRGEFTGMPDGTLYCTAAGIPQEDFLTGRTGFVILHPLSGFVGRPIAVEHTDGKVEISKIPNEIVPDQPYLLVRSMTHEPLPGLKVNIRMEGDSWETEDHRNWTDASFKTYCRPLSLPYPYKIKKGEEVRHTATLTFVGKLPSDPARATVAVRIGKPIGKMPRIGVSVLPEDALAAVREAPIVRAAGVQHINVRIDLRTMEWQKSLESYARLVKATGAEIVLEIIIPGAEKPVDEVGAVAKAVRAVGLKPTAVFITPAADLRSYPPGTPFPDAVPSWEDIASAARKHFKTARIGGGMLSNFTELNRKRPPKKLFDFIGHATSGLVHAADDRSVMETLESISYIVRSTKAIIGRTPYRIGPSHIGNSFNPYGSAVTPNPTGGRVTMARIDPRHRGLFGAAWHLGYLSQVAKGGVEAATVASPAGEFGIAYSRLPHPQPWFDTHKDAKVYPVFHIVRGIAAAAGAKHLETVSSDVGRVRTVAWKKGKETHLWLANIRDEPVEVKLRGLSKGKTTLVMIDEDSFESAVCDPLFGDVSRSFSGATITLKPFAVAHFMTRA